MCWQDESSSARSPNSDRMFESQDSFADTISKICNKINAAHVDVSKAKDRDIIVYGRRKKKDDSKISGRDIVQSSKKILVLVPSKRKVDEEGMKGAIDALKKLKKGKGILYVEDVFDKVLTRLSPRGLFDVCSLSEEQKEAVREIGFGDFLDLEVKELNASLCTFLIKHFDPSSCMLKLKNGNLEIAKDDVHTTFGLPMGRRAVEEASYGNKTEEYEKFLVEWRKQWNIGKGSPPSRIIKEKLIQNNVADDMFKINFALYVVSTILNSNQNKDSNFRILALFGKRLIAGS